MSSLSDTPRNFAGRVDSSLQKTSPKPCLYNRCLSPLSHHYKEERGSTSCNIGSCYESSSFVWGGKQNPLRNRKRRIVKANSKGAQDQWESHPQQRNPRTTSSAMVFSFFSPGRAAQALNPGTKPFCFHLSVQSLGPFPTTSASYILCSASTPDQSLSAQALCQALPPACNYKMNHLSQTNCLNCIFLSFSRYIIQRPMTWVVSLRPT